MNRSLAQELGHDIALAGQPNASSAMVVSVAEGESRRSILVIGQRVVPINFETYLEVVDLGKAKASRSVQRLRVISRIASMVSIALLALVVAAGFTGLLQYRVVLTGSMMPTIAPGDVVIGVSPSLKTPQVGDVILFRVKRFDGTETSLFSHRIIAGNPVSGFQTKGDANSQADVFTPKLDEVSGVEIFTIPKLGLLLTLQNLLLLGVVVIAAWLILQSAIEPRAD